MHPDLESLFYKAEENYLQAVEMKLFKHHINSLAQRLQTYEVLRDQEIDIFQPVADRLVEAFAQESTPLLEQALKQWIAILRYAAMAMLLNNPEFLQRRLLEWLTDLVEVQQRQSIEAKLAQLLQDRLREVLTEEQRNLIAPFIDQAQHTLLGATALYA